MIDLAKLDQCPFCHGPLETGELSATTVMAESNVDGIFPRNPRALACNPYAKRNPKVAGFLDNNPLLAKRCPRCFIVITEDRSLP